MDCVCGDKCSVQAAVAQSMGHPIHQEGQSAFKCCMNKYSLQRWYLGLLNGFVNIWLFHAGAQLGTQLDQQWAGLHLQGMA